MNVPVDELSRSAYVLDGPGWRSTGDGVFPSRRSGCPRQGMVNVPTLQIAKGSVSCNLLVGLELACNFCTHVRVFRALGNHEHIWFFFFCRLGNSFHVWYLLVWVHNAAG